MSIISIGTGTGILPALKTLGLVSGDTVVIKAGSYPGIDLRGFPGITIITDGGVVNFTSSLNLGGISNVTIDGSIGKNNCNFTYSGKDFSIFNSGNGGNIGLTVKGFDFGNTAATVFDSQTKIQIPAWSGPILTYIGTPETTVFTNLKVDTCKISGKTQMHAGTYEACTTYHMVNIGCSYTNIFVDNQGVGGTTKIFGSSFYKTVVKNWIIVGENVQVGDVGIIFINGNIVVDSVKRLGGYGYFARHIQVGLDQNSDSSFSNIIDVNTNHYGSVDVRLDPKLLNKNLPIPLYGGNISYTYNTIGNKKDDGTYVTSAVVLGGMADETGKVFKFTLKNNFSYNSMAGGMAGTSSLLKSNYPVGTVVLDASNNIDLLPGVPLPKGYIVDEINFVPTVNSPLIGKGVAILPITTDINGTIRSNPPDVGAVQSLVKPTIISTFSDYLAKTVTITYSDGTKNVIT